MILIIFNNTFKFQFKSNFNFNLKVNVMFGHVSDHPLDIFKHLSAWRSERVSIKHGLLNIWYQLQLSNSHCVSTVKFLL